MDGGQKRLSKECNCLGGYQRQKSWSSSLKPRYLKSELQWTDWPGSVDAYSCRWKMPFDQPRPTASDMFSIAIDGQSAGVYSPADISIGDDGWIVTGNCPLLWVTERGFPTGNSMKMALMCLMGIPTGADERHQTQILWQFDNDGGGPGRWHGRTSAPRGLR